MFKALTLPMLVSVLLHGAIIALVLIELPDSSPIIKKATPNFIKAELVKMEKTKPKVKKKPKPAPAKKPKPKPNTKTDNLTKLAAKEKQRQLQLTEQKKKEELERIKREQEERDRLDQERQQQEEIERELADAIEAENIQQQAETEDDLANSYTALISSVITENWSRPPSARNNMEAELVLQLVPTGEVVSVSIVKSSGDTAFDRSAEQAVQRAQRFPELQKLPARVFEKYFRRFRLKFKPEDLRL